MIGAFVRHANVRATAHYGHLANDVKAAAAARIANWIEASMIGGHELDAWMMFCALFY